MNEPIKRVVEAMQGLPDENQNVIAEYDAYFLDASAIFKYYPHSSLRKRISDE